MSDMRLIGTRGYSQTLHDSVTGNVSGTVMNVDGCGFLSLQIIGDFDGSLAFKGTLNDVNYDNIPARNKYTKEIVYSATSVGIYEIECGGMKSVVVPISDNTSGNITVIGRALPIAGPNTIDSIKLVGNDISGGALLPVSVVTDDSGNAVLRIVDAAPFAYDSASDTIKTTVTSGNINVLGSVVVSSGNIDANVSGNVVVTSGNIDAKQSTHDNLNCNANLQVNDADNSFNNPAFVEDVTTKGNATGGTDTTLIDTTKNFEADILNGTTAIISVDGIDYYREIIGSVGNTFTFSSLYPGVAAFVTLTGSAGASIGIRCKDVGVVGNSYKIILEEGTGVSSDSAVAWDAGTTTLTITSSTDGDGNPEGIMPGNLELLFAGVPAVDALFSVDDDFTGGTPLDLVASPGASFTGGIDAVEVGAGAAYEIRRKVAVGDTVDVQVTGSITGKQASDTITRGNVADPYAAGDVVSTVAGEVMEFASVGTANQMVAVLGARMLIALDAAVTAGVVGFRLHLYNGVPTAIADNAAFNLPGGDRAKYLGYITLSTPIRLGDTQWGQDDNINFTCKLAGTSLYGILQTIGAYTPTVNAVKTIYINVAPV